MKDFFLSPVGGFAVLSFCFLVAFVLSQRARLKWEQEKYIFAGFILSVCVLLFSTELSMIISVILLMLILTQVICVPVKKFPLVTDFKPDGVYAKMCKFPEWPEKRVKIIHQGRILYGMDNRQLFYADGRLITVYSFNELTWIPVALVVKKIHLTA